MNKLIALIATASLALTLSGPVQARSGGFSGGNRYVPHFGNGGGFHGAYGEHYGFRQGFGRGRGFGFYDYPARPFWTQPCYDYAINPYRCQYAYPYQYGY